MPYIKQEDRNRIDPALGSFGEGPKNAGELNYLLTVLCIKYFSNNGGRYQQINDVVGALEGCKLEFYRRLAAPYEDTKIEENGDVY
jgi:hypothetical protein